VTSKRSVLQLIDFSLQPETSHLVFPPAGDRIPIAIDSWKVRDYVFTGYVSGSSDPVIALAADANWIVYSRRLVKLLSTEDALREGIERGLEMRRVERELLKDEPPQPIQVVIPKGMLAPDDEDLPAVGQYL